MDKRQFLKTSGAFLTTSLLSHLASADSATPRTNWAGNLTYHTDKLLAPETVEEVQQMVKNTPKLRALGSRHSFNTIADSTAAQISLTALDSMVLNPQAKTVTVGAGVRYGTLAPYIDQQGFALHNLASLPHITAVGACATATHGSGVKNGNLSTAVSGMEIVSADGQLLHLSKDKDGESFLGTVVHLGGLGVVTKITLKVQPTYQVKQVVYENLSMGQLEHNLDAIFSSGYSVSLFTNWQDHRISQVWIKSRVDQSDSSAIPPLFYGATAAKQKLHPLPGHDATPCTEQMGIPGPWYERLPHFRMNFTPSSGAEIQTEYFVPRAKGYEAILAVEQLKDKITPHLFITELRTIAADDLWMSPAYQQDCMAIHFTWKPESDEIHAVLPLIEAKLAPFNAKPHWGKVFTMPPSRVQQVYGNTPRYQALLKQYDAGGKFRNQFIDSNIFGA
ncbi:xylitol oxidase [Acidisarcina polymorpha]|uniref:Xylitol oxidase n=1 Tax=Acidisarcina polymorpha TaxID=2211140 RepID=A0A2Z5G8I2_9BACT|nr:FAD-binding protein [Acidisarcina polymorpha]AXC14876.1 xylitol oxidase [Acidisarcina polymorpha]